MPTARLKRPVLSFVYRRNLRLLSYWFVSLFNLSRAKAYIGILFCKRSLIIYINLEGDIYILFDGTGFTYQNTHGYFASEVVFFRAPKGRRKIRAMSKMSAGIICKTIE